MSISKDNVRANLIINRELKAKLQEIAEKENRSFNNLVITVLKDYVEKATK